VRGPSFTNFAEAQGDRSDILLHWAA